MAAPPVDAAVAASAASRIRSRSICSGVGSTSNLDRRSLRRRRRSSTQSLSCSHDRKRTTPTGPRPPFRSRSRPPPPRGPPRGGGGPRLDGGGPPRGMGWSRPNEGGGRPTGGGAAAVPRLPAPTPPLASLPLVIQAGLFDTPLPLPLIVDEGLIKGAYLKEMQHISCAVNF